MAKPRVDNYQWPSKPYYLSIHEVTQQQYEKAVKANPSRFKHATHPVEMICWDDAVKFCDSLSAMPEESVIGRAYRLPTEAEWEFACRAGTSTRYSFGNDESRLPDYAWFERNKLRSASQGEAVIPMFPMLAADPKIPHIRVVDQSHPVGQRQPNAWGLYDMHGNVWEWCQNVLEGTSGRVHRGGSWNSSASLCQSASPSTIGPTPVPIRSASAWPSTWRRRSSRRRKGSEPGSIHCGA